jgi:DNA polymerase III sliding clamp (beta) subunit (PCNA family)
MPAENTTTETRLSVAADELRTALRAVRYAVSSDPDLPMLTGVLLDVDGEDVRVAATDRYRLAVSTLSGAEVTGPSADVLVPVALVDELLAALDGDAPTATVRVAGGDITAAVDGRTIRGRRLDHEFPDYRRLLRTEAAHRIDVDSARLRAEVFEAPTRTVRQEDGGTEHQVSVLTLTPDGGLSLMPGSAGVLEMGLDREFLLQALDAGGGGQLVLELDGPIAPLAIRDPDRAGDISMLMPVRLT